MTSQPHPNSNMTVNCFSMRRATNNTSQSSWKYPAGCHFFSIGCVERLRHDSTAVTSNLISENIEWRKWLRETGPFFIFIWHIASGYLVEQNRQRRGNWGQSGRRSPADNQDHCTGCEGSRCVSQYSMSVSLSSVKDWLDWVCVAPTALNISLLACSHQARFGFRSSFPEVM